MSGFLQESTKQPVTISDLADFLLTYSYMEYIEITGFTPKILKLVFCSKHVFTDK
jgi:hypothetical protein